MTPAVPGLLPREVQAGGLSIPSLDLELPEGVTVGTCIYSIHHHVDYVTNPFTFDAARWLKAEHAQDKVALQAVFNPFSLGHRACLGKPLVYMEISIAVARLVWEYDMRLAREQKIDAGIAKDIAQGKRRSGECHVQDWFLSGSFALDVDFRARAGEEKADSGVEGCG